MASLALVPELYCTLFYGVSKNATFTSRKALLSPFANCEGTLAVLTIVSEKSLLESLHHVILL
ncbi:MAG TPA: hypothetical protein VFE96_05095 [Candidatus Bathyarchaeia archaeon]|nr:hypothetical protein [Candidatus Bathyarchaeia archaeon]